MPRSQHAAPCTGARRAPGGMSNGEVIDPRASVIDLREGALDRSDGGRSQRTAPTVTARAPALDRTTQLVGGGPAVRLSWWPLPVLFAMLCAAGLAIADAVEPSSHWFNWHLAVAWSLYAPLGVVGVIGALHLHRRGGGRLPQSRLSATTDRKVIFTVPSLCHPDTTNALRRVLDSIDQHAPENLVHWRIDVVTEEGADAAVLDQLRRRRHLRVLVVPSAYETRNGAKFKTRANQYALEDRRRHGEDDAEVYVYHLDDDTHVGLDTIASLAEFIETHHDCHYLAQGTLAFPRELTSSRLAWYCDAIRPADDVTRFAFFTGKLGRPLGGLHGEHVIIRADIEDEIGWDYRDTVIEDAYFALEFARRYPGRSTTLSSFSYGASPSSVSELIRQRRRWSEGLLRLVFKRSLPWRIKLPLFYSVLCWSLAPVQFVPLMVGVALALGVPLLPPRSWIIALWAIGVSTLIWQYTQGVKVNMAASRDQRSTWWRSALCVPGLYVFAAIETYAAVLGIIRFIGIGRQQRSEVISKPL